MICWLLYSYHIVKCKIPLWQLVKLFEFAYLFSRERPAAIPIEIKSIDDTSNFDEFPDSDILTPTGKLPVSLQHISDSVPVLPCLQIIQTPLLFVLFPCLLPSTATPVSNQTEADLKNKDWVFINYTYKRFEGLTARGAIPSYMKSGKRWTPSDTTMKPEWVVQTPAVWGTSARWGELCSLLPKCWGFSSHRTLQIIKGINFVRCFPP